MSTHLYNLKDIESQISVKSHRLQVYNRIKQILKDGADTYKSRWFWELLQNAMDAVNKDQQVEVKVIITEGKIQFLHTGSPFKIDEIVQLIVQGSSKSQDENTTGRFGTGFMTTYALAEKVRIEGFLHDHESFDFILDRKADTEEEFLEKQEASREKLNDSIQQSRDDRPFSTSFTYECLSEAYETAKHGLQEVKSILPLALAFNSKIRKVSLDIEGIILNYEVYNQNKQPFNNDLELMELDVLVTNSPNPIKITGLKSGDLEVVAMDIRLLHLDFSNELPHLFFSFPLQHSKRLGVEFFINGGSFDVRPEREDINIGKNNETPVLNNKKLLSKAFSLIPDLLAEMQEHSFSDLHRLLKVQNDFIDNWDNEWLKQEKINLIGHLHKRQIITCGKWPGRLTSLNELLLASNPDNSFRKQLYNLIEPLFTNMVPDYLLAENLYDIVLEYHRIAPELTLGGLFTLTDLCKKVQGMERLEALAEVLGFNELHQVLSWLDAFYALILIADPDLLNQYSVVLNQKRQFIRSSNQLKTDQVDDPELISIALQIGTDWDARIIFKHITQLNPLYEPLKKGILVNQLVAQMNETSSELYSREERQIANARLLKWLIEQEEFEKLRSYQIFSLLKAEIRKSAFVLGPHRILAPKVTWEQMFPLYAGLVRSNDCLHDIYGKHLTIDNIQKLHDKGFIFKYPLLLQKGVLNRAELQKLLVKKDDRLKLFDTISETSDWEIEYSDFAFLTGNDNHILKNRQSGKGSIDILKFVLQEALVQDNNFRRQQVIKNSKGEEIVLRVARWVSRLQEIQWVYFKPDENQEGTAIEINEKPNSLNISKLVKAAPELKEYVKSDNAVAFFEMLGISVADLFRSLITSETEQLTWDKVFTSLLQNPKMTADVAKRLVDDPKTLEEFEKREQNRKLVQRNQQIGFCLEKVFEELVRTYNTRMSIVREPFGSDYVIEESDFLSDTGQEQLLRIGKKYIELKVTGKEFASMTPLQVETAVNNKSDFALVVFEFTAENSQIDNQSVLNTARVVDNIGDIVEGKYNNYLSYNKQEASLVQEDIQVQIAIGGGGDIRFRIKAAVWRAGKPLLQYFNELLTIQNESLGKE